MEIDRQIRRIADCVDGQIGVCVRDLPSGREMGVNLDQPLPMASVCKIPVLVTAFRQHERGALNLDERAEFTAGRRVGGSGLLSAFAPGLTVAVRDLLLMMIVVSDNAATDAVLERIGTALVTDEMQGLGLPGIHVDRTIRCLLADIDAAFDPRLAGLPYGGWDDAIKQHPDLKAKAESLDEKRRAVNEAASDRDTATVRDMARLCGQIALGQCASAESCEAMVAILDKQQLNSRLPRDLPVDVRFPHKTGTLGSGAVVNDAGILYLGDEPTAAIAVLSRDVRDPIHVTASRLAEIGRLVYDHYTAR